MVVNFRWFRARGLPVGAVLGVTDDCNDGRRMRLPSAVEEVSTTTGP